MSDNILLLSDSYKVGHWKQYPPKTNHIYSYFESRGGDFSHTVFFGLQHIIEKYLTKPFDEYDIVEAAELYEQHFGSRDLFNVDGWHRLLEVHGGYFPVVIKAVPEGSRIPTGNILMSIENLDPEFPWITNYLETILSQVWYPTTVATLSNEARRVILKFLNETGDPSLIDFKLHDFGFRGASSVESASIGGGAHLVNFLGTDTVPALTFLRDYYDAKTAAGYSVPASEHSTMTSWGKEHEVDAYRNMVEKYGHLPFYSVVSDSYDLYNAAEELWGKALKDEVVAAEGTLVVRPDSGDPSIVVNHLLEILGSQFGTTKNEKGYKVLNPKVRVIQGDGMELSSIQRTLHTMRLAGWSADNVTFGMGGGLLQKVNRDTCKFAFKCSSAVINGERVDVFKQPATDAGKNSKRGRLDLTRSPTGHYKTVKEGLNGVESILEPVFFQGEMQRFETIDKIRSRAKV